ncbi:hypothetical protein [Paractinoplanes atraurantiacus]|uniref:Tryptophan-associated transmembrane protein (Trp_oprn_chp) n=1 Tax=Paractinoplanes atraurantiacus TaxID=1036182 RepID=A0A285IF70_9ACTN|nr:hypothetical protein [Actinoplanes atraurantiacus]SNY45591.1 hypothetical protein SAMN05421748_107256 [Actinoplanes atraurantiacus]
MSTFALAGRRVVLFAAVYAALVVIVQAVNLTVVTAGATDPTSVTTTASVLLVSSLAGLIGVVCVLVLFISVTVWTIAAHRLSASGPGFLGYAALVLTTVLIALAYVLPTRMPTVATIVATDSALRLGAVAVLIAGVLTVRARMRRLTGEATLGARQPLVTADDWDASTWDPTVMSEIDRRRRR